MASQVAATAADRASTMALLIGMLSWLLGYLSERLLLNVLTAAAAVLGAAWLLAHVDVRWKGGAPPFGGGAPSGGGARRGGRYKRTKLEVQLGPDEAAHPPSRPRENAWRAVVNAVLVENAWDNLCNSIIQEFIYDLWYSHLTPDREMPAEVRRVLNTAFGELARAARRLKLGPFLLRDVARVVTDALELLRVARKNIGAGAWAGMSGAERDAALKREMEALGEIHPALLQPEMEYRVLNKIADGLCGTLLRPEDASFPLARSMAREILTAAVLRPVMGICNPQLANRLVLWAVGAVRGGGAARAAGVDPAGAGDGGEDAEGGEGAGAGGEEDPVEDPIEERGRRSARLEAAPAMGAEELESLRSSAPPFSAAAGGASLFAAPQGGGPSTPPRKPQQVGGAAPGPGTPPAALPAFGATAAEGGAPIAPCGSLPRASAIADPLGVRQARGLGEAGGGVGEGLGGEEGEDEWVDLRSGPGQQQQPEGAVDLTSSIHSDLSFDSDSAGAPTPGSGSGGHGGGAAEGGRAAQLEPPPEREAGRRTAHVLDASTHEQTGRRFIVYTVQVSQESDNGKWRVWWVVRRFSNFEALHRRLREYPAYCYKLPPKRLLFYTNEADFMEVRRTQLQKYLQALLRNDMLAESHEVWDFLSEDSQVYKLDLQLKDGGFISQVQATAERAVGKANRAVSGSSSALEAIFRRTTSSSRRAGGAGGGAGGEGSVPSSAGSRSAAGAEDSGGGAAGGGGGGAGPSGNRGGGVEDGMAEDDGGGLDAWTREDDDDDPDEAPIGGGQNLLSVHLQELVFEVFQLNRKSFVRRQIVLLTRQVLVVLLGPALDDLLVGLVGNLRSEEMAAAAVNALHRVLWPRGRWFLSPPAQPPPAATPTPQTPPPSPGALPSGSPARSREPALAPPAVAGAGEDPPPGERDAHNAEEVRRILSIQFAPSSALVQLVGRRTYTKGLGDVYDLLQSPILLQQVGYGLLEVLVGGLFPELRTVVFDVQRGYV